MYRSLLTIAAVALVSGCLAHLQNAQGERQVSAEPVSMTWVRTVDGWERSELLSMQSEPFETPALHPLLVATFQLTASLFALVAFPSVMKSR